MCRKPARPSCERHRNRRHRVGGGPGLAAARQSRADRLRGAPGEVGLVRASRRADRVCEGVGALLGRDAGAGRGVARGDSRGPLDGVADRRFRGLRGDPGERRGDPFGWRPGVRQPGGRPRGRRRFRQDGLGLLRVLRGSGGRQRSRCGGAASGDGAQAGASGRGDAANIGRCLRGRVCGRRGRYCLVHALGDRRLDLPAAGAGGDSGKGRGASDRGGDRFGGFDTGLS